MGGIFSNPSFTPGSATTDKEDLIVTVGSGDAAERLRVIDIDTAVNEDTGERYRIEGLQGPERSRTIYEDDDGNKLAEPIVTQTQVGGDLGRSTLYQLLKSGQFDNIVKKGKVDSQDDRTIVRFTNTNSGVDLTDTFFKEGLLDPAEWSTEAHEKLVQDGKIQRAFDEQEINALTRSGRVLTPEEEAKVAAHQANSQIFGDIRDKLHGGLSLVEGQGLEGVAYDRGARSTSNVGYDAPVSDAFNTLNPGAHEDANQFKEKALNYRWYDPKYHSGVEFEYNDRNLDGESYNPITDAFKLGWNGLLIDAGGFLAALGTSTQDVPWLGDALKSTGSGIRDRRALEASQSATLPIQSLKDIPSDSGEWTETFANGIEWFGVNAAQSAPYLGLAVAATAVAAVAGPAAGVLSTLPLFATHAGNVWNQVDPTIRHSSDDPEAILRQKKAAGKAYLAGSFMAALDRVGLAGIVRPSSILNKAGRDQAVSYIAKRNAGYKTTDIYIPNGTQLAQARQQFNGALKLETQEFLGAVGAQATDQLTKNRIVSIALQRMLLPAVSEGTTEAAQELIATLTAAGINEDVSVGSKALEFLHGEAENNDEIKDILLNAFAAGAAIGGGLSTAGGIRDAGKAAVQRSGLADFKDELRNKFENLYAAHADPNSDAYEGTVGDQLAARKESIRNETEANSSEGYNVKSVAFGEANPVYKDLTSSEVDTADTIENSTPTKENPLGLSGVIGYYAGKLVKSALGSDLTITVQEQSKAARELVSRVGVGRGAGASGRRYEGHRDWLGATFKKILELPTIQNQLGVNLSKRRSRRDFTKIVRLVGEANESGRKLTDAEITEINGTLETRQKLTRKNLPDYQAAARRFETSADNMRLAEISAARKEYGEAKYDKDGNPLNTTARVETAYLPGWWRRHQRISREKVAKDVKGWNNFLKGKINAALSDHKTGKKKLPKEVAESIASKDFIEKFTNNILRGGETEAEIDAFSHVGGARWGSSLEGKQRSLNLSDEFDSAADREQYGSFKKFTNDDIIEIFEHKADSTARNVSQLEYFGDGGRDLDSLFKQMHVELVEAGYTAKEASKIVGRAAKTTKDIIDSSDGNYKPIENEFLAKAQSYILQYTTLVGLLLAGPASIAEFGTVAFDLRGNKEAMTAIGHSIEQLKSGVKSALVNTPIEIAQAVGIPVSSKLRIDNKMNDVLMNIGAPTEITNLYRRAGVDFEVPLGDIMKNVHAWFFKGTLIQGITEVQKWINAANGIDFIRNRSEQLLLSVNEDGTFKEGVQLTQNQGDAYHELRSIGINVPALLKALQSVADGEQRSNAISNVLNPNLEVDFTGVDLNPNTVIENEVKIGIQNLVNERIQNPGAANRPLIFQDPHFRLLTQFNGYLSTVTTTLVPKLWNDKVGRAIRQKNPQLAYDAFALIVVMIALGGLGQYVKDLLKYGEKTPYINDNTKLFQRAFAGSGILGQYEKLLDIVHPLYPQKGEGFVSRTVGAALGSGGRNFEGIQSVLESTISDQENADSRALNNFFKLTPGLSSLPVIRKKVVDYLSGDE